MLWAHPHHTENQPRNQGLKRSGIKDLQEKIMRIGVLTIDSKEEKVSFGPRCLLEIRTTKDGKEVISPELETESDVDHWTEQMIGEIETIRKEAKRKLVTYR
jgi:hypothetical protein